MTMLEWKFDEHGDGPGATPDDGERPRWHRGRGRLSRLAALVLLAAVAGGVLWWRSWQAQEAMRRDVDAVLRLEWAAWRANDADLLATTIDPSVDERTRRGWIEDLTSWPLSATHGLERGSDPVLVNGLVSVDVEVMVDAAGIEPLLFHMPRFYRRGAPGLQRTLPDDQYWGPRRERHTRFFDISYHAPDEEAVETLARDLDERYLVAHRQILGRLPPGDEPRLAVRVAPLPVVADPSFFAPDGGKGLALVLSSPSLLSQPDGVQRSQILRWQVADRVAVMLLDRASDLPPPGSGWGTVVNGIRTWQAARWFGRPTPQVALYTGTLREAVRRDQLLPLWEVESPFVTDPAQARLAMAQGYALAAYVAERGGPERFATLLRIRRNRFSGREAFPNEIIPPALGIGVDEFERDWHAWVRKSFAPS